jgi:hypothetical protein
MATGILGVATTTAAGYVTPYTVPASGVSVTLVNVYFCNKAGTAAKIRLGWTSSATPSAAQWLDYDHEIAASGGTMERTCLQPQPGMKLMVYSDTAGVDVTVSGLEQGGTGNTSVVASASTTAASYVTVYTVPASGVTTAACTLYVCNVTSGEAKVRIGFGKNATPDSLVEYDHPVAANGGTMELGCYTFAPGDKVFVYSDVAGVAVSVGALQSA